LFGLLLSVLLACAMACAGQVAPPPKVPAPAQPAAGPVGTPAQAAPVTPQDVEEMTNPRYLLELAKVHMQFNALSRAEELLRKAQPLAKEQDLKDQIGVQLATVLRSKLDFKGAIAQLEEALSHSSNVLGRNQSVMTLSDLYSLAGQPDKAEKVLTDQLESLSGAKARPEDAWARTILNQRLVSLWQRQEGKIEKMRTATEEAVAKDPQNKDLLERLTSLYNAPPPDFAKAVGVYEKLLQLSPNDTQLMSRLALAYQQTKQYNKAIEIHQKIMAADPRGGAFSASQIAQLLLQSGKKEEAVKWAKEHMTGDVGLPLLVSFYEQAGLVQEAEEALVKLREQAAQPRQKADYSVRLAELALRRKDYKKAEAELQKVLKDFPDDKFLTTRANMDLARLKQEQNPGAPRGPNAPPPPPVPVAPPPQPPKVPDK
jgi:tetratricopeptide (TPR) repeat protein